MLLTMFDNLLHILLQELRLKASALFKNQTNINKSKTITTKAQNVKITNTKKSLHYELICPIYEMIFHYTRILGIFPFQFNSTTLELIPVTSGFSYNLFRFNVCYLVVTQFKAIFLFLLNWWTNFEFEEIRGGYFMQLGFVTGYFLLYAMIFAYSGFNRDIFASTVSSCFQLEEHILHGKIRILILNQVF